jgi:DNA-binding transcriptional LysR family regulator
MDCNDVRAFLAVARHGSLRAAAQFLNITQPTVARHIADLESALGGPLFVRTGKGHELSSFGRSIFEAAEDMEVAAKRVFRDKIVHLTQTSIPIRITADEWPVRMLADAAPDIQKVVPNIKLEFVNKQEVTASARRDGDIRISHGLPPKGDHISRRVAFLDCAIYGSTKYTASYPECFSEKRYSHCSWIGYIDEFSGYQSMRWLAARMRDGHIHYRAPSVDIIERLARSGVGLAILPTYLGNRQPELVQVSEPIQELRADYWLIVTRGARRLSSIDTLCKWIEGTLNKK